MSLPHPTTIYAVLDPRTQQARYVGKTVAPLATRARCHLRARDRSHRSAWFRSLAAAGVIPDFFTLEVVGPLGDWREAERFWIAYFRFLGAALVNQCQGGEGLQNGNQTSWRCGQRAPNRGRPMSAEARAKLSAAQLGQKRGPLSQEHRQKLSRLKKGKTTGPWTVARRAAFQVEDRSWSPERRAAFQAKMAAKYAAGWSPYKVHQSQVKL